MSDKTKYCKNRILILFSSSLSLTIQIEQIFFYEQNKLHFLQKSRLVVLFKVSFHLEGYSLTLIAKIFLDQMYIGKPVLITKLSNNTFLHLIMNRHQKQQQRAINLHIRSLLKKVLVLVSLKDYLQPLAIKKVWGDYQVFQYKRESRKK